MSQNAPLVEAAQAASADESHTPSPHGETEEPAAARASSDADEEAVEAAEEAAKAAKKAEKAARKAQKANEKLAEREARKASEAEEAARHGNGKLHFESPVGRDEVAAYFEAIVEGLRKGELQFRQGEDSLILSPPDRVEIEVKVTRKHGREKLAFEIEWRTDEPEDLSILAG